MRSRAGVQAPAVYEGLRPLPRTPPRRQAPWTLCMKTGKFSGPIPRYQLRIFSTKETTPYSEERHPGPATPKLQVHGYPNK